MFDDKSGQLMLISAFLLAIAVVAISLMLNNVIYASNLAYVGFMGQSRYDNLNFQQTTANEMVYAYNQYNSNPALYKKYLEDYESTINSITSIKGRYIDIASPGGVPDPHPLSNPLSAQHLLSIYSQSSHLTYAITTGTDTPTTYKIELQNPTPATIFNNGVDRSSLTVKVTDQATGNPIAGVKVIVGYDRTSGKITDNAGILQPVDGWATDGSGLLTVYYSDSGALGGIATLRAYIGSTQSGTQSIAVSSAAVPSYIIDVSPHSTAATPLTFLSYNGNSLQLTAVVQDTNGNYMPGVTVKFKIAGTAMAADINGGVGNVVTDASGTAIAYFHDTDPTACTAIVYVTDINDGSTSNSVYISCQPPTMYGGSPVIDNTKPITVTHSSGSDYNINIPIKFDAPLTNGNIITNTITVVPANAITVNPPYYTLATGYLTIPVKMTGNPSYTVTFKDTFTATCTDPSYQSDYSKDGTLTVTGDKNTATATLTFP